MARASRIFVFCLMLTVGAEALKLRKSLANCAQNAWQFELQKMFTNFVFLGIQRLGRCVDRPPPSGAEVTETVQL
jgi:hypothetical protein